MGCGAIGQSWNKCDTKAAELCPNGDNVIGQTVEPYLTGGVEGLSWDWSLNVSEGRPERRTLIADGAAPSTCRGLIKPGGGTVGFKASWSKSGVLGLSERNANVGHFKTACRGYLKASNGVKKAS